jgi:hypothetical protein
MPTEALGYPGNCVEISRETQKTFNNSNKTRPIFSDPKKRRTGAEGMSGAGGRMENFDEKRQQKR